MRMSTKRKILKYDKSGYIVKTIVKHEENLLSDVQKTLSYKILLFQNQCMLKKTNFQLRMYLYNVIKIFGDKIVPSREKDGFYPLRIFIL